MLSKEDLIHCLQHYPEVAEHIQSVAEERYNLVKMHEQVAMYPDVTMEDHSTQLNQSQNDDQEQSKSCLSIEHLIINPESYIGQTISAIGHILVLIISLILPYQVNYFY